jgi:CRISPR-associated endonuclease/helicase Cas3
MLSASLANKQRDQFVTAYLKGLGVHKQHIPGSTKALYPLATKVCREDVTSTPIQSRASVCRSVDVKRLPSEEDAIKLIQLAIEKGQCVCWIRNTISDAYTSFKNISENLCISADNVHLFHSRFTNHDRAVIESGILERFGPNSGEHQRSGHVLIATQVVEQSLDLDFDWMITDLAPVDLLIQRAGRLQRHIRSKTGNRIDELYDQRATPTLHVISPDPEVVRNPSWLDEVLPRTKYVYQNIGQLWLTMKLLASYGCMKMPDMARDLIEGVYGDIEAIPEHLKTATSEAENEAIANRSLARFNTLLLEHGYCLKSAHKSIWPDDVYAPTRLTSDAETVVLFKVDDSGRPYPLHSDDPFPEQSSQLSISLRDWNAALSSLPEQWRQWVDRYHENNPKFPRFMQVLPLVGDVAPAYDSAGGWNLAKQSPHGGER